MAYTAMGDYAGPYDDADYSSKDTERKTATSKTETPVKRQPEDKKYKAAKESNPLNKYRSYTYNFTLSGLIKSDLAQPDKWRESELKLVILKSGGKGNSQIQVTSDTNYQLNTQQANAARADYASRDPRRVDLSSDQKNQPLADLGKEFIGSFNANSPGRFDMYIDGVEIETLMSFTKESGTTLPTAIKFDVIEPYSINGFIEALHVASVAAGYPNYSQATFILKVDFVGYPDGADFTSPEILKNGSRYFAFRFTGIEVDLSEKGTIYRCAGVPTEQVAFGQANELKKPVTMSGKTVKDILTDLTAKITKQIKDDFKEANPNVSTQGFDEIAVAFPTRDSQNKLDYTGVNAIGQSPVVEILKDAAIYKFDDPAKTTKENSYSTANSKNPVPAEKSKEPEKLKLHPSSGNPPQVQFAEGQKIHEIMTALVRDSKYISDALEQKKIDDDGYFNYFLIKTEVIDKPEINPISRKPFQKITFSIFPYKVHFTRIPNFAAEFYPSEKLAIQCLREYNYFYTGKNVDVLKFKLNFNTLFYEALPAAMANNKSPGGVESAGKSNSSKVEVTGTDIENAKNSQTPQGTAQSAAQPVQQSGGNAGQPRYDDPYYTLARNMHEAVINSKTSMLTGDLEISGDPFFLVTGGIGNYNPPTDGKGKTKDNEADYLSKEVLININFRNPIDIGPLSSGGRAIFDEKRLPFSGVYMIIKCVSTFKNGEFVQRLEIMRKPGQILEDGVKATEAKDKEKTSPSPNNTVVQETTRATDSPGSRASELDSAIALAGGLPSSGLPGALSSLVNVAGGLGGSLGQLSGAASSLGVSGSSLLNRVGNAANAGIGALGNANSALGAGFAGDLNKLASGIRLQGAGLIDQSNIRAITNAATEFGGKVESLVTKYGVPGSGIGQGATVLLNGTVPAVPTVNILPSGGNPLAMTSPAATVSGALSNIKSGITASVGNLKAQAEVLTADIKGKLTKLSSGIKNDPAAIAAQFGIDPSQLAGLSAGFQSKILPKLKSLADQVPDGTNLNTAVNKGLMLKYIPADKLANLPATSSYKLAPGPEVDKAYVSSLVKGGNLDKLADAFGTLNVRNIPSDSLPAGEIVSALRTEISALSNNAAQLSKADASSLGGKISSLGSQLASTAGSLQSKLSASAGSIQATVNSAGGSLQSSLTAPAGSLNGVASQLNTALGGTTQILSGSAAQLNSTIGALGARMPQTLGSPAAVEARLKSVADQFEQYVNNSNLRLNLEKSVTAKYGSLNQDLNKAVNSLGDPNAPQYTGDDPIIRARLGLPPSKKE